MDPRAQFSANLRRHRKRLGLSQEALGYEAGLHRTEIEKLERGDRDARLTTVVKVARGLGIKPAELLRGL
jgi:transcriptional regulator with XRE-family HTH domain